MSMEEFDELRARLRRAHDENGKLQEKLNAALQADPTGRVPVFVDAIRAALPIVRFGVSNLDPRTVTRWPYEALATFAAALSQMPELGPDIAECAIELRAFAHEAKLFEQERVDRGTYDGPDPIDIGLLAQYARGEFTRMGALEQAGLIQIDLTDEGREAVREVAGLTEPEERNVADATNSA